MRPLALAVLATLACPPTRAEPPLRLPAARWAPFAPGAAVAQPFPAALSPGSPVRAGLPTTSAPTSPNAQCRAAIGMAERMSGVPDRLMQAIGAVESGRRDESGAVSAYPWTINAEGVGSYYASKAEAIAAVTALRARGVRSIDVGCMQINLMHHADAFTSLEEAFDPAANAAYAARFLLRLLGQTGSWPAAAAGYHSLTPDIGADYARRVLAIWARPAPRGTLPAPMPAPEVPVSASFAAQTGAAGRILPLPGSLGPSGTGRGLELLPCRADTAGLRRRRHAHLVTAYPGGNVPGKNV